MGTRYACSLRHDPAAGRLHSIGNGTPRIRKCRYCGGRLHVERGRWGIFEWRGDNRYPLAAAIETTHSHKIADRWIEENRPADGSTNVVARWLPEECFE
jgi:hypothetical protein